MTPVDHLFVVLLILVPLYSARSFRRYVAGARRGNSVPRPRLYLQTQALQWALFAGLALVWAWRDRESALLGVTAPEGNGFWLALLLAGLSTAWLVRMIHSAGRLDDATRRKQLDALGDLLYFLPENVRDYRHFVALSITAGIVEELIYRGFLIWYLSQAMPTWAAAVGSSLLFAIGHTYQGPAGMLRVFGIGLFFALLYLIGGTIWLPVLMHALMDMLQGAALMAARAQRQSA